MTALTSMPVLLIQNGQANEITGIIREKININIFAFIVYL